MVSRRKRQWWVLGFGVVFVLGFVGELTQPFVGRGSIRSPNIDVARLRAHVRMLAETLTPRTYEEPARLDRVATYIADELRNVGLEPFEQTYDIKGRVYRNVRVLVGPPTPERIVVGAHYDACEGLPGADDNASGVAVLIELARALVASPPSSTVELVAYTLEEPPHFATRYMGSAMHVKALANEGVHVRAMLSLEMLGYYSDEPGSQHVPAPLLQLFYPSRADFIAVIGRIGDERIVRTTKRAMRGASSLPVYAMVAPRSVPGVDFSDHASYWDANVPAAMITDTAFFRNDNYHTARDTPDTLDYDRMRLAAEGVYAAVQALAQ